MGYWWSNAKMVDLLDRIADLKERNRTLEASLKSEIDALKQRRADDEARHKQEIAAVKRDQTEADLLKVSLELAWALVVEKRPVSDPSVIALMQQQSLLRQQLGGFAQPGGVFGGLGSLFRP